MSAFNKLWKRSSNKEIVPSATVKQGDKLKVETIQDDQPYNPFTEVYLLEHHKDIVKHLVHIDQYSFATAGCDGEVVIWDQQCGDVQHILRGHNRPVSYMCIMKYTSLNGTDSSVLLTASSDKQIIIWDVESGSELKRLTNNKSTPRCLATLEYENQSVFCSGGDCLCLWSARGEQLDCLATDTEEDIQQMEIIKGSRIVAVIDKQLYVFSIYSDQQTTKASPTVKLKLSKKLPAHREAIGSLVVLNDTTFASGSVDGAIRIWTCNHEYTLVKEFNAVTQYVGEDKLYPFSIQYMLVMQQRYLVAAIGASICIYNAVNGLKVAEKNNAHFSKINHLALIHDGYLLASCGDDGRIRLWGNQAQGSTDVNCNSGISKLLSISTEDLKKVSVPVSLELLGECIAHTGAVERLVDCGDQGFASCGVDGLVILWKNGRKERIKRWMNLRELLHESQTSGIV